MNECVEERLKLQRRGGPRARDSWGLRWTAVLGVGSEATHSGGLWLWGKGVGLGPPESPSPFSPSPCSAPELHTEQRRTLDTAQPEPGRQPWPQLGPCPGVASSRPARQPPRRRHLLPLGPRFPPGGRPQCAGPAPLASWPGPSSRLPRPAGRRRGEAWGSGREGLPAAGSGAAASGPGEAGAPSGRSPGAGSAGAAPPGRAACRRAVEAGRAAAGREPTGRHWHQGGSGGWTIVPAPRGEESEVWASMLKSSPAQRGKAARGRPGTAPRGAEVREDADTVSNPHRASLPAWLPPLPLNCDGEPGAEPGSGSPHAPRVGRDGTKRGEGFWEPGQSGEGLGAEL